MWQDIPGLTGWQASDQGQIKNPRGKIVRQQPAPRGYLKVHVGKTTRLVHKLILLAFYGPGEKPTHRNDNRRDNRLSNLCYGGSEHAKVGLICSKGHEMVGANVATWGSNRICIACRDGKPARRQLPEYL